MKKILNILISITLIATSTTILVACNKPTNNKENKRNKPYHILEPKQPPENSNWKLIDNPKFEIQNNYNSNKKYILVLKNIENEYSIETDVRIFKPDYMWNLFESEILYRWDGDGIPEIPEINPSTGEITNWK